MQLNKAIIIGSGIAGIASAIRLAVKGFDVTVYEQNSTYGGKIGLLENNGYKFDTGPSVFTKPEYIEELFRLANEPLQDYFEYTKLPLACKYFYEDGTIVNAYTNKELFAAELKEKLNEDGGNTLSYLDKSNKLFNKTGEFFISHSLQKIASYFKKDFLHACTGFEIKHLTKKLHHYNNQHFRNLKTVQLFNRFATYNGSSPYKSSAMLSLIATLEHCNGAYYPKGGTKSIADALYKLAVKKGVEFKFNTPVQSIITTNSKIRGVVVNHENIYCNTVVSNCDVYFTYKNLLKQNDIAQKIIKQERSSSAIIFYWGMSKKFDNLDLHNIFFSSNYEREFEHIFKLKNLYNDPTIYVNITAKQEPDKHAPSGKENWFVMINVPSCENINWDNAISTAKQNVINKLNNILQQDITKCMDTENVLHPKLIEKNTSSYLGSLYGTSSNSKLAAFLRHSNFSKTYKGLYFVGGSVHPGGGIPLCLKSAEIVCNGIK